MTGLLDGLGPTLVRRGHWGAHPSVGWPVEEADVRGIVVHHTGRTADTDHGLGAVVRIQRFHAVDRGWGDIGYSFVVLGDGRVAEGRDHSAETVAPRGVVAGHALGHNVGTLGVAVAGRFHDHLPGSQAWASLVDLLATVARNCDLDPRGGPVKLVEGGTLPAVICGHGDIADRSCPGASLRQHLEALRTEVAGLIDQGASGTLR